MMPPTTTGVSCSRAGVRQREDPLRRQPRDVGRRDLGERGVAIAARIAVVTRPVLLRSHLAKRAARAPQQMDALIVRPQLQIVEALVEHDARRASCRRSSAP